MLQDPSDLLILVPDTIGDEIVALRKALKNIFINQNIDCIDYVDKTKRKHIAPEGKIRIVTFHSSRGLEAANVILFGIERLQVLSKKTSIDAMRLGYIGVSRAIFNLTICIRSNKRNLITDFIEKAISHISTNYE